MGASLGSWAAPLFAFWRGCDIEALLLFFDSAYRANLRPGFPPKSRGFSYAASMQSRLRNGAVITIHRLPERMVSISPASAAL
jgi:hypothetical protein